MADVEPDTVAVGTAGWNIPREQATAFPDDGRHLQRYARILRCVEIDSSFHRSHRPQTYARWATETPAGFRFAVKLPRTVTHDGRLVDVGDPLAAFLDEVAMLGTRLAVLLVQLPPSLAFDADAAERFFVQFRALHAGAIVCEPRHAGWFMPDADELLKRHRIGRVAADPASTPAAAVPGGWLGPAGDGRGAIVYHRWHGAPKVYWSAYDAAWLAARAEELRRWPEGTERWCIFDNTAAGAALGNALSLIDDLADQPPARPTPSAISRAAPR